MEKTEKFIFCGKTKNSQDAEKSAINAGKANNAEGGYYLNNGVYAYGYFKKI